MTQTITPLDNQNVQIPNVMLQYNQITLKQSNSWSDILFIFYAQINNKNIYIK
ncbi:MAG: hypothetical protein IIT97_02380 [Mycoplasmataceae bacterium]|nr:hypothetical protein [Mycoplasmataceae bacterium]